MEIEQRENGTTTVLRLDGRLTMVSAPALRASVDAAVTEGRIHVVVDVSGVGFIDSSGLGALVAGLRRTRQAGGDLRIAGAGDQVLGVLRRTNLDRVLRPHATVSDAIDGW